MDRERARFILKSFRPCGADHGSTDFAEALRFANGDPELSQWLARERAFDTGFATALDRLSMPASLRESILAHLAVERGDLPQPKDRIDAMFVGAMATLEPPAGLRIEIVAAMERTESIRVHRTRFRRRAMIPIAAAAGISLAFVITRHSPGPEIVKVPKLPMEVVETEFIRAFESPDFTLDQKREDQRELFDHLKTRKLPCPCCLPKGLASLKGIGCRELVIDGRVGSIICFDERENGIVHLVIFRRQDVCDELPDRDRPLLTQHGKWAVARWADEDRVFVLIGDRTDPRRLSALF